MVKIVTILKKFTLISIHEIKKKWLRLLQKKEESGKASLSSLICEQTSIVSLVAEKFLEHLKNI